MCAVSSDQERQPRAVAARREGPVYAIIAAAGSGSRFGSDKLFYDIGERTVLEHTLAAFAASGNVDSIVVVTSQASLEKVRALAVRYAKIATVCLGGARRRDSVLAGLLCCEDAEIVLIHDAARPVVDDALIERAVRAARERGAAVPVVPLSDTIKVVDSTGRVERTIDRSLLRAAQTPQAFRYELIRSAYEAAGNADFTDDAAVVEHFGSPVFAFDGSPANVKITTPSDAIAAGLSLASRASEDRGES